jgi:hypothetical protein
MNPRCLPLCLGVALLTCSAVPAAEVVVARKKIVQAEVTLTKYFEQLDVSPGRLRYLSDERLTRAFPGHFFFQVRYAPGSAKRLPTGLEEVNLFVVDRDGKARSLTHYDDLAALLQGRFGDVTTEARAVEVTRVFAALGVGRHPGYVFAPAEVKTVSDPTGLTTVARMVVREGGTGHLEAEVRVGKNGKVNRLYWRSSLRPAARVVRTVAVVKRATTIATEELQRLNVSTTTLRQITVAEVEPIFPGAVFFSYVADPDKAAKTAWARRDLIVVEADGHPVLMTEGADLRNYARAAFDPVVTDEQARLAMRLYLRLLEVRYSGVTFKPPIDSIRIEPIATGGRAVVARLEAANGPGYIEVNWSFGKRGRVTLWKVEIRPGAKL